MGQISFLGGLTIGPVTAADSSFPASVNNVALTSTPSPKSSGVDSGFVVRAINSPSSFVTLYGVGANDAVTQGDTLLLRCQQATQLRITFSATPSDVVSVLYVLGTLLLEAPTASTQTSPNYIKLLEVMGVGTVEYLVSGLA